MSTQERKPVRVHAFPGGIHPPENKQQSVQMPIAFAGIPRELIYPLPQHVGEPAVPIVNVGQAVLKGEIIAEAGGLIGAPLHAATSGTIIAIEDRPLPHPSGTSGLCIVVKPDGADTWIAHRGCRDHTMLPPAELVPIIHQAGITGLGGAGFPTAVKLSLRDDQAINTLLINGSECEPYITADDMLMRERAVDIIAGVKILQHMVNPQQTLIGIEDNKPEAIEAMRAASAGDDSIAIAVFPTKYPSGGEKQLIQILTGREVPSGALPIDIGVLCQNVGTAAAIYRAVIHGEPLINRITTITGGACGKPRNVEVLLGTPVSHLLQLADFHSGRAARLIIGGPMMGFAVNNAYVPVVKITNCILAPTPHEMPPPPPAQACIRCGLCAEACPASLLPQQLYWFARGKEYEKLDTHHLFDCIECGACSYVCPSNIPLVQYYRASKTQIRQARQEKIQSDQAKIRFEARQYRIAQQEAEKAAKRQARLDAAKQRASVNGDSNTVDKADVIQAAIARAKEKKSLQQAPAAVSGDAAQAAIERAQASRNSSALPAPQEKAEAAVAALRQRLRKAEENLAQAQTAGSDTVAILTSTVATLRQKLDAAQRDLTEIESP